MNNDLIDENHSDIDVYNNLANTHNDSYLQLDNNSIQYKNNNTNCINEKQINILQKYINSECFKPKQWVGSLILNA